MVVVTRAWRALREKKWAWWVAGTGAVVAAVGLGFWLFGTVQTALLPKATDSPKTFLEGYNTGFILAQHHRIDDAIVAYKGALKADPNGFAAAYNLGVLYLEKGQKAGGRAALEDAYAMFGRAAQIDPKSPQAHYNAGVAAQALGRNDEAKKHFQRALELDPKMPGVADRLQALLR